MNPTPQPSKVIQMSRNFTSASLLLALLSITAQLRAQSQPSPALIAETDRAAVRTQANLASARTRMNEAMTAMANNHLEEAYAEASEALHEAPTGGAGASGTRSALVSDYTTISLKYARSLINNGRYLQAETVAKSVLDPSVNPGCRDAVKLLSDLEQPEVLNKTVTPKSAAQRDEVVKLLREADGYAQSGRHELAIRKYEEVLLIDPYNRAARLGMESINNAKIKYSDEAYNETRGRMLWLTEKSWERPPHRSKQGRSTESIGRQELKGTEQIVAKLNTIIIPKIRLSDSPVSEAVEYLKQKSVEQDPSKKGVNIFLKLSSGAAPTGGTNAPATPPAEPHVTLAMGQVPLYVALDYICKLSNLKLKIDPYAVSLVPLTETTDILITKEYKVPPTFLPPKPIDSTAGVAQIGSSGIPDPNKSRVAQRMNAKDFLTEQGVTFPEGASANYLSAGSKLVVRNTRDNMDVIDSLVEAAMGVTPSQVEIQTKFLEINQNNLQELGFSWLLGPFSIGGGVYGSGGGNGGAVDSAGFPFGNPMAGGAVMNPVGALRSGDQAISGNSVDAAIAGNIGGNSPAPGIFSIAGVFTDPQFQLVIRALNQKKGIDLMSAPKVTTKSGVKAVVKVVNEFIYPKQYDPPQIPQSTQNLNNGGGGGVGNNSQIPPTITPSFPRDFTKQDLGVTLEAKPTIGPDGYTIDLELNPKVVDFDGFINYGSPINSVGYSGNPSLVDIGGGLVAFGIPPTAQTLTTNTINQPVFSFREVNTFVTVWDGQTVALGGLIREDIQKVQDKVPFLGDMPMAGRLFRSDVDQKIKKNLVIFVTPRIIDAEGQLRRGDTEEPEIVKPLGLPEDLPQPTNASAAVRSK